MSNVYDPSKDPLKATESGRFNPYSHTEEGVATTSPTGKPRVKPKNVPWLIAAMAGGVVGCEALASSPVPPGVQVAAHVCAIALAGALGIISPGWRGR